MDRGGSGYSCRRLTAPSGGSDPAQPQQNCGNRQQFPRRLRVQQPIPANRAAIRNSLFPSGPVIGLSTTPRPSNRAIRPTTLATRSQTARCTAGSRTTPLRADRAGPASNCGLISATAQAPACTSAKRGQHGGQADEAGVADQGLDRIGDHRGGQITGVGLLMHHHARIGAQLPGELAVADIHRVHLRRPVRQQHVGEPAGRGADIQTNPALGRKPEMPQARDPASARRARPRDDPGRAPTAPRRRPAGRPPCRPPDRRKTPSPP